MEKPTERMLKLRYYFWCGVLRLMKLFDNLLVKLAMIFGLGTWLAFTALSGVPAYSLPIEVPEEAKLMCANSVGLKRLTAVSGDRTYYVKAHCTNDDVVYRTIKVEKGV